MIVKHPLHILYRDVRYVGLVLRLAFALTFAGGFTMVFTYSYTFAGVLGGFLALDRFFVIKYYKNLHTNKFK